MAASSPYPNTYTFSLLFPDLHIDREFRSLEPTDNATAQILTERDADCGVARPSKSTMGVIFRTVRRALVGAGAGAGVGVGYLVSVTTCTAPLPRDDPLWRSRHFSQLWPPGNPVMSDVTSRRVPLDRLWPELRNDEAALALAFCRALMGGWALAPQRAILTAALRNPETSDQAFTAAQARASNYDIGEQLMDHFEVVDRPAGAVVMRAGGSPRDRAGRDTDGLLVVGARIDRATGEAELRLESLFFNSRDKVPGTNTSPVKEQLHLLYARALVVSGAHGVMQ